MKPKLSQKSKNTKSNSIKVPEINYPEAVAESTKIPKVIILLGAQMGRPFVTNSYTDGIFNYTEAGFRDKDNDVYRIIKMESPSLTLYSPKDGKDLWDKAYKAYTEKPRFVRNPLTVNDIIEYFKK